MKSPQLVILGIITLLSLSAVMVSGDPETSGDPGDVWGDSSTGSSLNVSGSPEQRDPILLTAFKGGDNSLKLWSSPGSSPSIVFDQWIFILFGSPGDSVKIKINDFERFNSSMDREVLNWSFSASRFDLGKVVVKIGNRSYRWEFLIIQHQALNWEPGNDGKRKGSYTLSDLNSATWKGALAVLFMSVVSIWFSHALVKYYKTKQGVKEI